MRADPSGAVELGEAIGREADVERLWTTLVERNVILSGRLGIGKTTLARLAVADAPTGWSGQLVSLGDVRNGPDACAAVVETLVSDDEVRPDQLGGEPPAALRVAIDAALDRCAAGLVLALDDFDRWLAATAKLPAVGYAPFTSTLARACAEQPKLRIVLISNTHLDRTISRLRPEPLIGLMEGAARIELDSLTAESGARLVMALLLGESITARDRAAFARSLADNCDHVPRWIHCAMAYFARRRKPIVDGDLERCLIEAVADLERPPWTLRRELAPALDDYMQPQRGLALSVLDQLALAEDQALTFTELRRSLAVELTIDDDAIRRVVAELLGDQLIRESGGQLRFHGELLRNAWLKLRYL
ncbi:MAG TPA: hypothetical protein VK034_00660 [Enhygromyxa sp.]|nr:hypothetical protein [Enhygromyxa sp.]